MRQIHKCFVRESGEPNDNCVLSIKSNKLIIPLYEIIVGLHIPKKKRLFDSPSKMMKNAFYFILKAFFVLKIFKFLSWLFGHVEKTAWLERQG